MSKNLVNNIFKELGKYLSCATHVFTIPKEYNGNVTAGIKNLVFLILLVQTIGRMRLFLHLQFDRYIRIKRSLYTF